MLYLLEIYGLSTRFLLLVCLDEFFELDDFFRLYSTEYQLKDSVDWRKFKRQLIFFSYCSIIKEDKPFTLRDLSREVAKLIFVK